MRSLSQLLATALLMATLSACQSSPDRQEADRAVVLQQNPVLAAYERRTSAEFERVLDDAERLRALPTDRTVQIPPKFRGIGDPTLEERRRQRLREVLLQNPLLLEVYKKDPDATAKLIDVILG